MSAKRLGSLLIAEGLVFAAARLFTLVYVIASETYIADEEKIPLSNFVPWLLISFAAVSVLMWAGAQFRTEPEGPWGDANPLRRGVLIVAFGFNAAVCVRAIIGVAASLHRGAEVLLGWVVAATVSGLITYAMARRGGVRARKVHD